MIPLRPYIVKDFFKSGKANMSDYSYIRIFRALANETHFALLRMMVKNKGIECPEIGRASPISQLPISLHLKELRNAQVIR